MKPTRLFIMFTALITMIFAESNLVNVPSGTADGTIISTIFNTSDETSVMDSPAEGLNDGELNCVEYPWTSDYLYLVEDINSFDSCNEIANTQNLSFNGCYEYSEEFCLPAGCYNDSYTGNYLYISEDNQCSDFSCNSWVCPDFPENNLADQFTSAQDCIANVGCAAECVCYETWFVNECPSGYYDCAGECDGSLVEDECGVCGGDNSTCTDDCTNLDCETNSNFLCDYSLVENLSNPGECRAYSEQNGISNHGQWFDAEYNCVDPGCYCENNDALCVWIESNSCIDNSCETNSEFNCNYNLVNGVSNSQDCHQWAEDNGLSNGGTWYDAENNCTEPGCYVSVYGDMNVWIDSNSCVNNDCDGWTEFSCEYSLASDSSNPDDCRQWAEDNGAEYHGERYEAESWCTEPGCYINNSGHVNYVDSNSCVAQDCDGWREFSCYYPNLLEGANSAQDCRDLAQSQGLEWHGDRYDACVDPGCYCETDQDAGCQWAGNTDCVDQDCEFDQTFDCQFDDVASSGLTAASFEECETLASSINYGFHGERFDVCVESGCYCNDLDSYCHWVGSNDCVDTECDGDQLFDCYYDEIVEATNHFECSLLSSSNNFNYNGFRFEIWDGETCRQPGCYVEGDQSWWFDYDDSIVGCTDQTACNFDSDATIDSGNCAYEFDCNGNCGGSFTINECGDCIGPALDFNLVWSKGSYGDYSVSEEEFNSLFQGSNSHVIRRLCEQCDDSHKEIYYKRLTDPQNFTPYYYMIDTWASTENILNVDFELYSSVEDLLSGANKWQYCNYDDGGVAFPRDCGPSGGVACLLYTSPSPRD